MSNFAQIDKVIQANLDKFRKPNALTVRPGYKITKGWITQQPAIVVTVQKKTSNINPTDAVPPVVGGIPTDVREATTIEKLRHTAPERHAALITMMRPEFRQPEFPTERDAQTGELLAKAPALAAVVAHTSKPKVAYQPAPNTPLTPVEGTMSITCHAGPDAAWLKLSEFLKGIKSQFTVGMYDCTSAHVLQALLAALKGKPQLSLVLDHPAPNKSRDQTDEQTQAALTKALGKREQFAWAAEANDPKVSSAIFPNAYHIKVAVKDHASFWLSSGNWNNSNQPDIDPFAANANMTEINATANKSDRDWHVVVEHEGLAKTFEAYLLNDYKQAIKLQAKAPAAAVAAMPPLLEALAESPEAPILGKTVTRKFFPPKVISGPVKVQPLLTPDTGAGNYAKNILKLIQSAQKSLDIQTQYIHPPKPGTDAAFQALIAAVKDRVDNKVNVRIILSEYEATGGWLEKLQEAGLSASIVRIQNGVHNKGFVVDSKVVALGSQNWSGDGVLRNRDASLIIYQEQAAQYFEQIFNYDWDNLAKQHLQSEVSTGPNPSPKGMAAD
jgi:PLD-like domain